MALRDSGEGEAGVTRKVALGSTAVFLPFRLADLFHRAVIALSPRPLPTGRGSQLA